MPKTLKWGQAYSVLLDVGAVTDAFTLDSSTLDGTDVLNGSTDFVDATEYILAVSVQRGRGAQTEQFQRTLHRRTTQATLIWLRDVR
jgi:hypothetical protein